MGFIASIGSNWQNAALNLTMFYRLLRGFGDIKDVDNAYWSLLPEIQFYLLMGLVIFFKQVKKIKLICLLWLLLIVIENFVVHIRILGLIINLQLGGFFIAGILFYKIAVEKEITIFNHLFILATLVINIILYVKWMQNGALVSIMLIYLIFYLFSYGKLKWMGNKVLLFLGTISYPLYLIHQNLGYNVIKQFEIWGYSNFFVIILTMVIFILLASLISFYIEKPMINFFRNTRFFKIDEMKNNRFKKSLP